MVPPWGFPCWAVCMVTPDQIIEDSDLSAFASAEPNVHDWLRCLAEGDFETHLRGRHMNIIVSGSLAYDRIMDFPGYFADHILPEKIHVLNVCFQVNGMKEKFGGTAGNIAYALTLMGEKPVISATIGRDYHRYFEWLAKNGISTENIKIIEDEFTASAYITTDQADNQITGFNPGAMKYSSSLDFDKLDPKETLVIVSPGNLEDMVNYPRPARPGGSTISLTPGNPCPCWMPKT